MEGFRGEILGTFASVLVFGLMKWSSDLKLKRASARTGMKHHAPNDTRYGAHLDLYLPIYEFLEGVIYMNLMVWSWCMA